MAAIWTWNNDFQFFGPSLISSAQVFPYTEAIFSPQSLQRVIIRFGCWAPFGIEGAGMPAWPIPGSWSAAIYLTDTSGYFRSLANDSWMEQTSSAAVSDGTTSSVSGSFVGPYPLVWDINARKAAPPPPSGELDLHVDITFQATTGGWTAAGTQVQRQAWLDINWLVSEPGP